MQRIKTGTIILGVIALIFGVDTLLSFNDAQTISEWFYNWLQSGWEAVAIYFTGVIVVFAHFWWFRPEKRDKE